MNEETKPFLWAHDDQANLQEPLDALKQHGWRYGDIPAASNVNWLFKQISDEFVALKNELSVQKEETEKSQALIAGLKDELATLGSSITETNEQLKATNNELASHKIEIEHNKEEIDTAHKNHQSFKAKAKELLGETLRNDNFNLGVSHQICSGLREMERLIRHYHPNFSGPTWPLQDRAVTVAENENDTMS